MSGAPSETVAVQGSEQRSNPNSVLPAPLPPTLSATYRVVDFYVDGTSGSNYAKVSPKGGVIQLADKRYTVSVWNYVRVKWTIGDVWVIFLANVTSTNFQIMYLYVTNGTSNFALRIFDYSAGTFETKIFEGAQTVYNRNATTAQVQMPALQFQPKAKGDNSLSILGSDIYLAGKYGEIINGTSRIAVYPIFNQIFPDADAYNELWVLLSDGRGNFYYAIIYMQTGKSNEALLAHVLRLNDYYKADWRNFKAYWSTAPFSGSLVLKSTVPGAAFKVDGFPFVLPDTGILEVKLPEGTRTLEALPSFQGPPGTRYAFWKWNDGTEQNPRTIDVYRQVSVTANYRTQFYLALNSPFGSPQGFGWYDQGSVANVSITPSFDHGNGTRRIFLSWNGAGSINAPTAQVTMDSPKALSAQWKKQYLVRFQLSDVPKGANLTLFVNGIENKLKGNYALEFWADADSQVSFDLRPAELLVRGEQYRVQQWKLPNGANATSGIRVEQPLTLSASFKLTNVFASQISIQVSPKSLVFEKNVKLAGKISPLLAGVPVKLYYSTDKSTWTLIGIAITGADGSYVYEWFPPVTGTIYVKASWEGNNSYKESASQIESITNSQDAARARDTVMSGLGTYIEQVLKDSTAGPVFASLLSPAFAMFSLATAVSSMFGPSPVIARIVALILGGGLVGMVYLFAPVLVTASVIALRRKRAISLKLVLPLASFWILSLALVVFGEKAPAGFVDALMQTSAVSLLISSALFFPILFGLLFARLFVRSERVEPAVYYVWPQYTTNR